MCTTNQVFEPGGKETEKVLLNADKQNVLEQRPQSQDGFQVDLSRCEVCNLIIRISERNSCGFVHVGTRIPDIM